MENKNKVEGLDQYQIEAWIFRLGSYPLEVKDTADYGESYRTEKMLVLKLENGRYATVHESGCSCYSSCDAEIDLHPNYKLAKESFDKYVKERKDMSY